MLVFCKTVMIRVLVLVLWAATAVAQEEINGDPEIVKPVPIPPELRLASPKDLVLDDPEMEAAVARAHDSIEVFLDRGLGSDGFSRRGAALKVLVIAENGQREHVWLAPFVRYSDGRFSGVLTRNERRIGGRAEGTRILFDADAISDWVFLEAGLRYGGFTTRVLIARRGDARDADLLESFANTTYPAHWQD